MAKHKSALASKAELILVDDHRLVIEALAKLLAREYTVVSALCDGLQLLELLKRRGADCIVLDLDMPSASGLSLIPRIRRLQPGAKILVLTMLQDREIADAALAAGADGFASKEATYTELTAAIAEVLAGRRYVSPRVPKSSHRAGLGAQHLALRRLTLRQQEIVLLMGEGIPATAIAQRLGLSPSTITFHKHNLMRVLGIDAEADLRQYAVLVRASAGAATEGAQPRPRSPH